MNMRRKYTLYIDSCALEKCFLTGQSLEDHGIKFTEYGLIGLAERSGLPFHVKIALLLTGQQVDAGSVYQAGLDVLRMRGEIEKMSLRLNKDLIPVAFIHKHSGFLGMSNTDYDFLTTTFADQASSCCALPYEDIFWRRRFNCRCKKTTIFGLLRGCNLESLNNVYYNVCFSIIVTSDHFAIYAARKIWCIRCGHSTVNLVPAKLVVKGNRTFTLGEKERHRRELESEIKAKIRLKSELTRFGEVIA